MKNKGIVILVFQSNQKQIKLQNWFLEQPYRLSVPRILRTTEPVNGNVRFVRKSSLQKRGMKNLKKMPYRGLKCI